MNKRGRQPQVQFLVSLLVASAASIGLFVFGAIRNHSTDYSYFIWNLFLSWLPLVFAVLLVRILRHKLWSSWPAVGASFLWLMLLPNSFYMVTDFIHLQEVSRVDLVYDAVMFSAFIFVSMVLGIASLYLIHREFRKRFSWQISDLWLAVIIFVSSFAIYLGRDLRWNSWDVLINPGGLIFDVSDRLLHPSAYPQMFLTIFVFFIFISSMYGLAWKAIQVVRQLPTE